MNETMVVEKAELSRKYRGRNAPKEFAHLFEPRTPESIEKGEDLQIPLGKNRADDTKVSLSGLGRVGHQEIPCADSDLPRKRPDRIRELGEAFQKFRIQTSDQPRGAQCRFRELMA
jgi:hypothetical protein